MRVGELIRQYRLRAELTAEGLNQLAGYSCKSTSRVYGTEAGLEPWWSTLVRRFIAALNIPEPEVMQCSDVPLEAHAAWMARQLGADVASDVPVKIYAASLAELGESETR